MVLGEKLSAIQCTIYEFAHNRLSSLGLDASLSKIVMDGVYRRFQEDAYHASLLQKVSEQRQPKAETHSGTANELKREVKKNGNTVYDDGKEYSDVPEQE